MREISDSEFEDNMFSILNRFFYVRLAAHVSNRCKSGIRPVVGRI